MGIGGFLFGDGKSPGILGSGQYEVKDHDVNTSAGALTGAAGLRQTLADEQAALRARTTPTVTASQIDGGPQGEIRTAQTGLVSDLQAAARGEGPSVAQEQLRRGVDANVAATVATMNTGRGMGGAGAVRDLVATQANARQQGAADAATLRAQEIAGARGQLAEVTGAVRGQDLQLATGNAQLSQQADLANQEAEGRARAAADDYMRSLIAQGYQVSQAEQMANVRLEELRTQSALDVEKMRMSAYESAAQRNAALVKSVAGGAASAFGIPTGG